uniref:F-box domain-containing protein n=1 Tax=Mola mola TaxID=94237 RepID=A0A3Q4APE8_MOLML
MKPCHPSLRSPSCPALPAEVWYHVFGFLSVEDKFSVRASCKSFRKLVDHGSLWRDWWVVLGFLRGKYNSKFWASLRRRKLHSVVVRRCRAKDWKQLAQSLPALTTLVLEHTSDARPDCLHGFPSLKRLAIRNSSTSVLLTAFTVCHPQQLTHLTLCDVTFPAITTGVFISAISQFINLTWLVCHKVGIRAMFAPMIRSILKCLPELKHLSLSTESLIVYPLASTEPLGGDGPPLSSLELRDCASDILPEDAMKLMPGLKSLALFRKLSKEGGGRTSVMWSLKTWLRALPQLSTLVVVRGPPVFTYVASIPASVTRLTLVSGFNTVDVEAVAARVPNLQHFHIDPWPHATQIPKLFPKLKSLKVRLGRIPEKAFLDLHQLQDLEILEVVGSHPHLSELAAKLRTLTKDRVQVVTSHHKRDVLSCSCVCQAY